jgi:hypothetical protein
MLGVARCSEVTPRFRSRVRALDKRADAGGQSRHCWRTERDMRMPTFMDYHDDLKLPAEAIKEIGQGARDGAKDEFGVRQIELYHNPEGKVYCLLEAPDEEAVRKHHAALDVPCGDVHRVESLM